jgi:hypothetical protein
VDRPATPPCRPAVHPSRHGHGQATGKTRNGGFILVLPGMLGGFGSLRRRVRRRLGRALV